MMMVIFETNFVHYERTQCTEEPESQLEQTMETITSMDEFINVPIHLRSDL